MEIPTRARVFTSVPSRSPHLELRSSSRRRIESSTLVSCGQPASRPASQQTSRLARPSLLSRPPAPSTFAHCRRNKRASRDMASGVWLLRPPPRRSHSPHSPTCSVPTPLAQTRGLLLRAHEMLGMYEMCWAASHSVHSPAVGPHDLPRAFAPPAAASYVASRSWQRDRAARSATSL